MGMCVRLPILFFLLFNHVEAGDKKVVIDQRLRVVPSFTYSAMTTHQWKEGSFTSKLLRPSLGFSYESRGYLFAMDIAAGIGPNLNSAADDAEEFVFAALAIGVGLNLGGSLRLWGSYVPQAQMISLEDHISLISNGGYKASISFPLWRPLFLLIDGYYLTYTDKSISTMIFTGVTFYY